MSLITDGLFSLIGSFFKELFNFKGEQAKTVQDSINLLSNINNADAESTVAAANALQGILTQGSFLEKNWRPVFMVILMLVVLASFFGYVPPDLNAPLTPTMDKIWTLLQIGLGGYLPLRTIEKIVQQVNIASVLKALIAKKII